MSKYNCHESLQLNLSLKALPVARAPMMYLVCDHRMSYLARASKTVQQNSLSEKNPEQDSNTHDMERKKAARTIGLSFSRR